jgi:putative phosphoesterase
MKLGIISDTHGGLKGWERALAGPLLKVDLILHAGDLLYHGPRNPYPEEYDPSTLALALNHSPAPLLIARGNCDAEGDQLLMDYPIQSPYVYIHIDNVAILMLHGHEMEVDDLWELGDRYRVNLLISGHTHIYKLLQKGPLTLVNPGSPSLPKGEEIPTVALLDTERLTITIVRIDTNVSVKEMGIIL